MNPISHLTISWVLANGQESSLRDRALVTVAGVIPDVDGLGLIAEWLTRHSAHPLFWWSDYHHVLAHNIGAAALVTGATALFAHRKRSTALVAAAAFHLHLLCDLVGARGPEGEQWPIPYLLPFSSRWPLTWSHQWALNAWPNVAITFAALLATLWFAWRRGVSPLEWFSPRANAALVATLRARFGEPIAPAVPRG